MGIRFSRDLMTLVFLFALIYWYRDTHGFIGTETITTTISSPTLIRINSEIAGDATVMRQL